MTKRAAGALLALSSLPGPFGIGTMGREARAFVDALAQAGMGWWQILPLGQAGPGDSPYQSISAFAGSLDYIDFALLYADGLLRASEYADCCDAFDADAGAADYEAQRREKIRLLLPVYTHASADLRRKVADFSRENAAWLEDYARYMAEETKLDADFFRTMQYIFHDQWHRLKAYANEKGISILGDLPIYVSPNSVETTFHPELFDKTGATAGCPPDYFSPDGQHWGNPIYDWAAMKADGYGWWIRRLDHAFHLYDKVRIDHFRGFEAYWSIPAGAKTAAEGHWEAGPGVPFFEMLRGWFGGELPIVAEDLGTLTPSFFAFKDACGFPGLKVLQFAFGGGADNAYLPHNSVQNCVYYTGTHDNNTTLGWFQSASVGEKAHLSSYFGFPVTVKNVVDTLCRAAYASTAAVCILPMQDILALGEEARMNVPGTPTGNWRWRMPASAFTPQLQKKFSQLAALYGRL